MFFAENEVATKLLFQRENPGRGSPSGERPGFFRKARRQRRSAKTHPEPGSVSRGRLIYCLNRSLCANISETLLNVCPARLLKPQSPARFLRVEPEYVPAEPDRLRRCFVTIGTARAEHEGTGGLSKLLQPLSQP